MTTRTGVNIQRLWWLSNKCSNISYSFCQSDEIYEYDVAPDFFAQVCGKHKQDFIRINEYPVKIIRYCAIIPSNRNQFLYEIYNLESDSQDNYSCFRIVKKGFYYLEEHNNQILYYVFDEEQQRMYCYINVSKNGIKIDTTDPFHEYIIKESRVINIVKKTKKKKIPK
ncbi:MAG: hypothetical protein LBE18_05815 [Planctomycetaceae bacterium]|nr:hypothetical protein [Planctomycetaceae bacterium]